LDKIYKDSKFLDISTSNNNTQFKNYPFPLIRNYKTYQDKLFSTPLFEQTINHGIFNKTFNSQINEYLNQKNESYYEHKMNNFSKVAHEFKTPLNAIIGLITEIKNNPSIISKVLSNIDIIHNLSNYLIFLISDITQFINHNTKNNIVIFIEKVYLKSIINFCFEILNSLLICKNSTYCINTDVEYDNQLDTIEIISNDMRLKQILLNFLSNSVKFTKSGLIKMKIQLKSKENKKYIKISVIDTGVGIREEDQKKIFNDIYSDLKNESNKHGSGLGLNICKFISEKLNHSLKFKSIYGEGSNFSLIIPESCLKLDEKIKYESNLNKSEFNNINKINTDKIQNKNHNSDIKENIKENKCDKNKKENLFLNLNSIKNIRKNIYDTSILSKKTIYFKDSFMDHEKVKITRNFISNDNYDITINNEEKTLTNENPLLFVYSNPNNRYFSDDKNSNNQNLNSSIYSYYNFENIQEIENLSNSFDKHNAFHNPEFFSQTNRISSICLGDNKETFKRSII